MIFLHKKRNQFRNQIRQREISAQREKKRLMLAEDYLKTTQIVNFQTLINKCQNREQACASILEILQQQQPSIQQRIGNLLTIRYWDSLEKRCHYGSQTKLFWKLMNRLLDLGQQIAFFLESTCQLSNLFFVALTESQAKGQEIFVYFNLMERIVNFFEQDSRKNDDSMRLNMCHEICNLLRTIYNTLNEDKINFSETNQKISFVFLHLQWLRVILSFYTPQNFEIKKNLMKLALLINRNLQNFSEQNIEFLTKVLISLLKTCTINQHVIVVIETVFNQVKDNPNLNQSFVKMLWSVSLNQDWPRYHHFQKYILFIQNLQLDSKKTELFLYLLYNLNVNGNSTYEIENMFVDIFQQRSYFFRMKKNLLEPLSLLFLSFTNIDISKNIIDEISQTFKYLLQTQKIKLENQRRQEMINFLLFHQIIKEDDLEEYCEYELAHKIRRYLSLEKETSDELFT